MWELLFHIWDESVICLNMTLSTLGDDARGAGLGDKFDVKSFSIC
jgi:hypothetical protein